MKEMYTRCLGKINVENFINDIYNENIPDIVTNIEDPNTAASTLMKKLQDKLDKHAPLKKIHLTLFPPGGGGG